MYKIVIMVKKSKMYDSNEVYNLVEKLKKDKTVKKMSFRLILVRKSRRQSLRKYLRDIIVCQMDD